MKKNVKDPQLSYGCKNLLNHTISGAIRDFKILWMQSFFEARSLEEHVFKPYINMFQDWFHFQNGSLYVLFSNFPTFCMLVMLHYTGTFLVIWYVYMYSIVVYMIEKGHFFCLFIFVVFFAAQSGFSGVLRHHSSLGITDIGDALTDGNAETGIPLLDTGGYINPVWLKFTVGSWKNAMQFDVTVSGQFLIGFISLY